MTDIWSFLLQSLTATGVAFLLFGVKAIFYDKLSPRWQFAIWGVLAAVLLLPAGRGGRYVLTEWPLVVEALKSALTGEFGTLAHVTAPIPLPPTAAPRSAADWLYLVYAAGVVLLLARYLVSYLLLRRALRRGRPVRDGRVEAVAGRYHLSVCPAVEVDGLPTAFICGVFRPVLALPAGVETDDKVILHELLHLKYKDVAWGWLICLFRCIHWCNPFMWMSAHWASCDLESLCDQRVLERLEGEDRRDYGRILLSMADERYASAPGTSSAANGGKNIRRRIEAIARFKRYPAGMALVSVCVALVLAVPLVVGVRADTVRQGGSHVVTMASARTTYCTTYAGAFDAYAKALLTGEISYRAMCAPLSEQNELAAACEGNVCDESWLWSRAGNVRSWPDAQSGYQIYNLTPVGGGWEGLLVLPLNYTPDGGEEWAGWDSATSSRWLAVQPLRAEKEGGRWVILPQGELRAVQGDVRVGGNLGLPAKVYEGQCGDFTIRVQLQTSASVNSTVRNNTASFGFWSVSTFDTTPRPHAEIDQAYWYDMVYAIYTGAQSDKAAYTEIGGSVSPLYGGASSAGMKRPKMGSSSNGHSSNGQSFGNHLLDEGEEWGDWIFLSGGGSSMDWETNQGYEFPTAYAAEVYLNGKMAAKLTLLPVEGGEWVEP